MSERLSDELIEVYTRMRPDRVSHTFHVEIIRKLAAELRERRAQDLTPFERIVMSAHRDRLAANDLEDRMLVAILDKVLAVNEGEP